MTDCSEAACFAAQLFAAAAQDLNLVESCQGLLGSTEGATRDRF